MGDNARQHAQMTAYDQTTDADASPAKRPRGSRSRLRPLSRRVLRRIARPYIRRRNRAIALAATVARLEADMESLRERHGEQIERLEDLVRELVLTAEALRAAVASLEQRKED